MQFAKRICLSRGPSRYGLKVVRRFATSGMLVAGIAILVSDAQATAKIPSYTVEQVPAFGAGYSILFGISCPRKNECVAVGNAWTSPQGALAETYSDGEWTPTALNNQGLSLVSLSGVWCTTLTSCVAVGQDGIGTSAPLPLIETLSTSGWVATQPQLPSGGESGGLDTLSCISIDRCVAAGYYVDSEGDTHALFETLSDSRWIAASSSNPPGATSLDVEGVTCMSTTSCYGVGWTNGSTDDGLLETLSGDTWQASTLGTADTWSSIWCASSIRCLVVGYNSNGIGETESLSGTSWTAGTMPGIGDGGTGNGIVGVSCKGKNFSCVAIGSWRPPAPDSSEPVLLIEKLTHGKWTATDVPEPGGDFFPGGISCPTLKTCVGAGSVPANNAGVAVEG